jgi:hypothetical protein
MKRNNKEKHEDAMRTERVKQASYAKMIDHPEKRTWSARMPAYSFTALCPDSRYRI